MFVDVELHGELTRGQTIADRRVTAVPLHNTDVCMDIDRPRFEANFLAAIKGPRAAHILGGYLGSMPRGRTARSDDSVKSDRQTAASMSALFLRSRPPPIVVIAAKREFRGDG